MTEKSVKYGLYLLPGFALFYSFSFIYPFVTSKAILFRAVTGLMFAAWAYLLVNRRSYLPKKSPLLILLGILLCWTALCNSFSLNPVKSFLGSFERMEAFFTLFHLYLYFLLAGIFLQEARDWRRFFQANILVSALSCLIALFLPDPGNGDISQFRLEGILGNSTFMAMFLLFNLFFTLLLLSQTEQRWKYICYSLMFCLQVFVLLLTGARSVIFGVLMGLFITCAYLVYKKALRFSVLALSGSALLLFFVISLFLLATIAPEHFDALTNRFSGLSTSVLTNDPRRYVWLAALDGIMENPVLGWGQEQFEIVFGQYYRPELWFAEPWYDRAHNVFLDWGVATGLPGLLLYLSLIFYAFRSILKSKTISTRSKAVLTGLMVAYSVSLQFHFDNLLSYFHFFSILAYLHVRETEHQAYSALAEKYTPTVSSWGKYGTTLALLVFLVLTPVYWFHYPVFSKAIALKNAVTHANARQYDQSFSFFNRALHLGGNSDQEVVEQLSERTIRIMADPQPPEELPATWFTAGKKALAEYNNSVSHTDARFLSLQSRLFAAAGDSTNALVAINKALALCPAMPALYIQRGNLALKDERFADALLPANNAFSLSPNDPITRLFYGTVFVLNAEYEKARNILAPLADEDGIVDNEQLLNAFFVMGQRKDVMAVMEKRARENHSDPAHQLALAATYLGYGLIEEANRLFDKVAADFPSYEEEIRQLRRR